MGTEEVSSGSQISSGIIMTQDRDSTTATAKSKESAELSKKIDSAFTNALAAFKEVAAGHKQKGTGEIKLFFKGIANKMESVIRKKEQKVTPEEKQLLDELGKLTEELGMLEKSIHKETKMHKETNIRTRNADTLDSLQSDWVDKKQAYEDLKARIPQTTLRFHEKVKLLKKQEKKVSKGMEILLSTPGTRGKKIQDIETSVYTLANRPYDSVTTTEEIEQMETCNRLAEHKGTLEKMVESFPDDKYVQANAQPILDKINRELRNRGYS